MIKTYKIIYGAFEDAEVHFEVNTDVFTEETARMTLDFFTWDYDKEEDPITECVKKYAFALIHHELGLNSQSVSGAIERFNCEGFGPIDGSIGIKLVYIEPYGLDDDLIQLKAIEE